MVKFTHPHQDPGSTVLNVLEPLEAPARNPDEECVAIVEPGGDKGVDKLLCSMEGEGGAEFCNIAEVEEGGFANFVYMFIKCELGVEYDPQICDRGAEGDVVARE